MDSNDSVDRAVPELDSHDWFTALDARHQALLRAGSVLRHYEAGAFITRRGEPSAHWIGVHTGLIKLAVYNADGRGATFSGVPAGGWCGEGSVLKRELRRYDVVAVRAANIILVPVELFHLLLAESLSFNAFVIRQLNERMGQFIATIENRQGLKVSCPEEIAFRKKWIDGQQLAKLAHPLAKNDYGRYLLQLLADKS